VEPGTRHVWARERSHDGSNFIYDVQVTNARGELVEQWEGLRLRAVEALAAPWSWPAALLGPYLERRFEELVAGSTVTVAVQSPAEDDRAANSQSALRQALAQPERIFRRADGKPVTTKERSLSAAHSRGFTIAVAGPDGVACDVEEVVPRADGIWDGLLGSDRLRMAGRISRERPEDLHTAATRLWNVVECLKKAGLSPEAPVVLDSISIDGWVLFRSGTLMIASCVVSAQGAEAPLAIGLALNHASRRPEPLPAVQAVVPGAE